MIKESKVISSKHDFRNIHKHASKITKQRMNNERPKNDHSILQNISILEYVMRT